MRTIGQPGGASHPITTWRALVLVIVLEVVRAGGGGFAPAPITFARGRKRRRAGVVRARRAPGHSAVREPEDLWVAELSERSLGR